MSSGGSLPAATGRLWRRLITLLAGSLSACLCPPSQLSSQRLQGRQAGGVEEEEEVEEEEDGEEER